MTEASGVKAHLLRALGAAERRETPFRHWLLRDVLPETAARSVCALPIAAPEIGDTKGKRETHNASRTFFAPETEDRFPVARSVAETFQDEDTVAAIGRIFGRSLAGSLLRIEYCQDNREFWLEPHTDISAKLITMLVYLSEEPQADDWGTDLYDGAMRPAGRAPGGFNKGLVFVPAGDTWHGYGKRPMEGIRRSLIINYVTPDWRSRHELAFPDRPCRP